MGLFILYYCDIQCRTLVQIEIASIAVSNQIRKASKNTITEIRFTTFAISAPLGMITNHSLPKWKGDGTSFALIYKSTLND